MINVKTVKDFVIGSTYFFKEIDGFKTKDTDHFVITNNPINKNILISNVKLGNDDLIIVSQETSVEQLFDYSKNGNALTCGKWLIPEICEYYSVSFDDVKRELGYRFKQMDDLRKYEECIYNSYCENDSMTLTDEQRMKAFEIYKKYRTIAS